MGRYVHQQPAHKTSFIHGHRIDGENIIQCRTYPSPQLFLCTTSKCEFAQPIITFKYFAHFTHFRLRHRICSTILYLNSVYELNTHSLHRQLNTNLLIINRTHHKVNYINYSKYTNSQIRSQLPIELRSCNTQSEYKL